MASGQGSTVIRQVDRLFRDGSVAGLGERQLLDRYVVRRDESAFAALLARHGPLVLGVCRRWLSDPHDVDDAFQATFLVLVKKARSIRDGDRLGPWLYGVAYRVASRARSQAIRRRSSESSAVDQVADPSPIAGADGELSPILDEELAKLPESGRSVVVLCDLEGLSTEEAAQQLGWPVGTVKSRLSRSRDKLRERLARRGYGPIAGVIATAALTDLASAAVDEGLFESTLKAASSYATSRAAVGAVSASAASLAQGVFRAMFLSKLKLAAVVVVAGGAVAATGGGVFARQQPKSAPSQVTSPGSSGEAQVSRPSPVDLASSSEDRTEAGRTRSARTPEELGIRLSRARRVLKMRDRQVKTATISLTEYEDAKDELQLVQAQIEAEGNEIRDEIELLKIQLEMREADVFTAKSRARLAKMEVERLSTMAKRLQGAVSHSEIEIAEANAEVAGAQVQAKEAASREILVRISQAERRMNRLRAITTATVSTSTDVPTPEAPTSAVRP